MIQYLDDINWISTILSEGKVILCPTDTIWGLSCNALDQAAVERIYSLKKRDRDKPLILLLNNIESLKSYTQNLHPRIETLIHFYNQPLTIIHQASEKIPRSLCDHKGTIAIRICQHPLLNKIITKSGFPLVSTSANLQGEKTPRTFNEIPEIIKSQVDYICQSERSEFNGQASRIISYDEKGELFFIR